MTRRPELVAFAYMLRDVGANPANPESRARYLDLIAPGETPQRAAEMAEMWGCALVARGILRALGVRHWLLGAPYVTGHALSDLETIGRDAGALHGPEREPEDGDVVIVGEGTKESPWHVWMALPDGEGLDGGQKDDDGYQVIRVRRHEVSGGWDTAHDDQTGRVVRRRVRWVIDGEQVLAALG